MTTQQKEEKIMLTLQQIRDKSPCGDGWTKLLKSLGNPPLDTVISLGDVAKSNGAEDAWWCVRALDWSDITLRRQVIAALIPPLERAAKHTTDKRVHDCVGALKDWTDGKAANLKEAAWAAWEAAEAAGAAGAAAGAAARAAWAAGAAGEAAWAAGAAGAAAETAWAAAEAAAEAAEAAWPAVRAAWAAEREAELEAQRADLIAAFPPLILKD